jgi:hypothetical protein
MNNLSDERNLAVRPRDVPSQSTRRTVSSVLKSLTPSGTSSNEGIFKSIVDYAYSDLLGYKGPELAIVDAETASCSLGDFQAYITTIKPYWSEYTNSVCDRSTSSDLSVGDVPQALFTCHTGTDLLDSLPIFGKALRTISGSSHSQTMAEFSKYMKVLDRELMSHSSDFTNSLDTLNSLQHVQSEIDEASAAVTHSQTQLQRMKELELELGCRHIQRLRRRERLRSVRELVSKVDRVLEAAQSIQALISVGDFASAQELVDGVKSLLDDVGDLKCLTRARSEISRFALNMSKDIEKEFLKEVVKVVFEDANIEDSKLNDLSAILHHRGVLEQVCHTRLVEGISRHFRKELERRGDGVVDYVLEKTVRMTEVIRTVGAGRHIGLIRLFDEFCPVAGERLKKIDFDTISELVSMYRDVSRLVGRLDELREALRRDLPTEGVDGDYSQFSHFSQFFLDRIRTKFTRVSSIEHRIEELHNTETWTKTVSTTEVVDRLALLLGESAVSLDARQISIHGKPVLIVPFAISLIDILIDLRLVLTNCPSLVVECLDTLSRLVRESNGETRILLLEGGLSKRTNRPVNATNLALGCHMVAFLTILVDEFCRSVCDTYGIVHPMVVSVGRLTGETIPLPLPTAIHESISELAHHIKIQLNDARLDILTKLAEILVDRFGDALTPWLLGENHAVDTIVKDFSQMYSVLSKSMDTDHIRRVFGRAFTDCGELFESRISESVDGEKLRVDLLYLYQHLAAHIQILPMLQAMVEVMLDCIDANFPLNDPESAGSISEVKLREALIR